MSLFPRIPKLRPASRIVVYRPKPITLSAAFASRIFSSKSQKRHDFIPEQEFQYPFTPLPVEFALGRQIRKYLGPRLSPMMMTLYLTENDLVRQHKRPNESAFAFFLDNHRRVLKRIGLRFYLPLVVRSFFFLICNARLIRRYQIETENAKTLLLNMNKKVKKAKRAKKAKVKKVKKGNENRDKIQ